LRSFRGQSALFDVALKWCVELKVPMSGKMGIRIYDVMNPEVFRKQLWKNMQLTVFGKLSFYH